MSLMLVVWNSNYSYLIQKAFDEYILSLFERPRTVNLNKDRAVIK